MTGLKLHLPPDFVDRAYSVFLLTNCEDYSPNDFSCRRFACVSPLSLGAAAARGTSPTSCATIAHLCWVSSSGTGPGLDSDCCESRPIPRIPCPSYRHRPCQLVASNEHLHNPLKYLASPPRGAIKPQDGIDGHLLRPLQVQGRDLKLTRSPALGWMVLRGG